jgi:hypothetical protein
VAYQLRESCTPEDIRRASFYVDGQETPYGTVLRDVLLEVYSVRSRKEKKGKINKNKKQKQKEQNKKQKNKNNKKTNTKTNSKTKKTKKRIISFF